MFSNFCIYANHVMDDTISRNASPARLEPAHSASDVGGNNAKKGSIILATNDASVAEYKVNVGKHLIKINGDSCVLLGVAQRVLEDFFSSFEFMSSMEAAAAFEATSLVSPLKMPCTSLLGSAPPKFMTGNRLPLADSGICVKYAAGQGNNTGDGDAKGSNNQNTLTRSHRTHFLRNEFNPKVRKLFENKRADKPFNLNCIPESIKRA